MPEVQTHPDYPYGAVATAFGEGSSLGFSPSVILQAIMGEVDRQIHEVPPLRFLIRNGKLIVKDGSQNGIPLAACPPGAAWAGEYQRQYWTEVLPYGWAGCGSLLRAT